MNKITRLNYHAKIKMRTKKSLEHVNKEAILISPMPLLIQKASKKWSLKKVLAKNNGLQRDQDERKDTRRCRT